MDSNTWMALAGGTALGALLGAGVVFISFARRLKAGELLQQQGEQARQLAAQQLTQARKQIEQLQRDNHELRLAVRPAPRPAPPPEPAIDPAEAARRHAEALLRPATPAEAPKAFKDTVVLQRPD
jgi:hypothetical protein